MTDVYLDFDEHIVAGEPHKREKAEVWKVAIGLQITGQSSNHHRRITEHTQDKCKTSIGQVRDKR